MHEIYFQESDWGERYWENYSKLQTMKNTWDPNNVFNHCHSVGSTNNTCCPDFEVFTTKSRQGSEQTRTFDPTNESADYWSAIHCYNFIIRVK